MPDTKPQPQLKSLQLDQLRLDGDTQPRVMINEKVIDEYTELYRDDYEFPPITVFFDGATHWLADGFHRYHASKKAGKEEVAAEIHVGTQRDAILYSAGANAMHGLRRTNPDKRKAVLMVLMDEEWSQWSDREIARRCGVNKSTVSRARESILAQSASMGESSQRSFVHHKTGKAAKMKTSKIGRRCSKRNDPNAARKPKRALAQTSFDMPHDPDHGASAIVSAMGEEYAQQLIVSLTNYLNKNA